jgi:hypothetical protein
LGSIRLGFPFRKGSLQVLSFSFASFLGLLLQPEDFVSRFRSAPVSSSLLCLSSLTLVTFLLCLLDDPGAQASLQIVPSFESARSVLR